MLLNNISKAHSLTASLRDLPFEFALRIKFLGKARNVDTQVEFFPDCSELFMREIELCLAGKAVVAARSFCSSDCKFWQEILLSDCPLGDILFSHPQVLRRSIVFFEYSIQGKKYPARRSIFQNQEKILLLEEFFLPAIESFL